jgi:hypothetical protein
LQSGGNIVCGNATRLNWETICPKTPDHETYILGNPPYLGSSMQSADQKEDMATVFKGIKNYKNLDYIACWFLLASKFISNASTRSAFVSTNSIVQGEQVVLLWSPIFSLDIEIFFAHQSFSWTNNAKGNAGVTCVIVGLRKTSLKQKFLFTNGICSEADNISPYLLKSKNQIVSKKNLPISNFPVMTYGSKPVDGGFLLLDDIEKNKLLSLNPEIKGMIKPFVGASEYIRGLKRFCLWITDESLSQAKSIELIRKRMLSVKETRLKSKKSSTALLAETPHLFGEIRYQNKKSLIIPSVSSERREYIPIGFLEKNIVISNKAMVLYEPPTHIFSIISSRMHMVWVRTVGGRMREDISYSSVLCYNTFPFPDISDKQKAKLEDHVFAVLDEREKHPEKTMAQLYDPDKMPDALRQAHHNMDIAIEQCYRAKPFTTDEERLEYLFKLYEEMIAAEKARG